MNILRVIANPKPTEQSASRKVEQAFTSALQAKYRDAKITTLDVYADEVPLLDDKLLPVFFGAKPTDDETARRRARQLEILELFLAADVVVIATPMWNFNAPPKLKAFMDTVMAAGKTFKYTAEGPVGLAPEKKVVICSASGSMYEGSAASYNTLHPMLETQFRFMGITDMTICHAGGQGLGPEKAAASTAAAIEQARAAAAKF